MTIAARDPIHSVGKLSDIEFQLRFGMSKEQARHLTDEKGRQARYNRQVKRRIDEASGPSVKSVGDIVRPTKGPHKGIPHKIIHIHDDGAYNIVPMLQQGQVNTYRLGAARCTEKELEQIKKPEAPKPAKAAKATPKPKEPVDRTGHVSVKDKDGKFVGRYKSQVDAEKLKPADKGHTYHMHKVNEEQIDELSKNLLGRYIGKSHATLYNHQKSSLDHAESLKRFGPKEKGEDPRKTVNRDHTLKAFVGSETKRDNRFTGISKAAKKISEDVQLDESVLNHIRDHVSADSITKHKDGTMTFRRGFFYSHGKTSWDHAESINDQLNKAAVGHKVVGHGRVDRPFKGGASTKTQSHFWVKVKLNEGEEVNEVSKDLATRYFNKASSSRGAADKAGDTKTLAKRDAGTSRAFNKITEDVITEGALANIAMNAAQDVRHRSSDEAKEHISNTVMAVVNQHKDHDRVTLHGAASDAIKAGVAQHAKLNEDTLDERTATHHIHIEDKNGKSHGKIAISAMDDANAKFQADRTVGNKPFRGMKVAKITRINEEEKEITKPFKLKRLKADYERQMDDAHGQIYNKQPKMKVSYVKPFGDNGFKSSDKHGHVKYWNQHGEASAKKHAGLNEDEQINEAKPYVSMDSTGKAVHVLDHKGKIRFTGTAKSAQAHFDDNFNKYSKPENEEEMQIDELDRNGSLKRYANRTTDDDSRKEGRALALKKRWGDNKYGLPEPRVKGVVREEASTNLLEARRGRPPKNAAPGREEDEREHVMMQLRKSVSLNGSKPVKFKDGQSHDVSGHHAEHVLAHYAGMSPKHKEMFQGHVDQSHHNLMSYDKWKPTEEVKHFDHRPLTGLSARTVKKPIERRPQLLSPMEKRLNLIKSIVAKQAKR
jgi:hypothetical protein